MEEEVLQSLYTIAKENGYMKDSFEFQKLMNDDEEARKTMYDISLKEGYTKSFDDFTELVTPSKKKIEERIKERESALNSEIIFSESPETDNPILSAFNDGVYKREIAEALGPILGDIEVISDENLDKLAEYNIKLNNNPPSKQKIAYEKAFSESLSENLKEIEKNPYGDLGEIQDRFNKGQFLSAEKEAYEDYRKNNKLNTDLLPKRELTFLDDLGAFYVAVNKAGAADSATALGEIGFSSIVALTNLQSISAGAAGAIALGGAAIATGVGAPFAPTAAVGGFFGGASALLDSTLRFNGYLNELLAEKGLEPSKENYRTILEDKDLIRELRAKAIKGGITVGAVDGITMMLSGSVAAR